MTQRKLYLFLGASTIWCYTLLCTAFWVSEYLALACVVAAIAIWWASPLTMRYARNTLEDLRAEMPISDLRTGAWSFLIGDPVFLALAGVFIVFGWNESYFGAWTSLTWFFACLAIGLAVGMLFHLLDGRMNYRNRGAGAALRSPTKLAHDFVAYPVLLGGLLYGGFPLLLHGGAWASLATVCVVAWLILAAFDMFMRDLDPRELHPDMIEIEGIIQARAWSYEQVLRGCR